LRWEHALHYVGSTVQCGQDGCPRSFQNFRYLKSHLEKHHAYLLCAAAADDDDDVNPSANKSHVEDENEIMDSDGSDPFSVHERTDVDLTASFMSFIGQLESKANVTYANIQIVVESFSSFLEDLSQYCTEKVTAMLSLLNISRTSAAVESCLDDLKCLSDVLNTVDTDYKRTQYLRKSGVLIEPEERVLSTRTDLRYVASSGYHVPIVVEDTMQYIPLEKLLGALLVNENCNKIMTHFSHAAKVQNTEVVTHYFDTNSFKQHPFFQKFPDGLALNLYVDAFETTNVLGSHTGVHKLEGLYMVVQNFHPLYQSQLSSIFLIALWYAQDAKTYGYSKILEPIVTALLKLESDEGAHVCIGRKEIVVRAALVFVSADNLGFNSLFGFCESFSATRFCRFCECTRAEADHVFTECQLKLRSRKSYDAAVSRVATPLYDIQLTGIKRGCPLNALQYWHVTENFVVDVMHDILEGIAPFELSLIFCKLVEDEQCKLSLDRLNSSVNLFNYSLADKNSRPPTLSSFHTIKMSASEMWCFLRNLPLLIGSFIPRQQMHWRLLLMLLEIIDIVFSPAITDNLCHFLGHLVEEHHCYFKKLFPDKQLLPKHHFLVHYVKCLQMSGPAVRYWSLRFEARHQIFKDMARTTNCFKNICKTLAKRFQRGLAFRLVSHTFSNCYECGPANEVVLSEFTNVVCDVVCRTTNLCQSDTVFVVSWVKVGHYILKPNIVAVHSINNGVPEFGTVTDIVAVDSKIYFVLNLLQTAHFDEHFHAYAVTHPGQKTVACVLLESLKDHIPLQYHVIKYEGEQNMYVSLRYTLF